MIYKQKLAESLNIIRLAFLNECHKAKIRVKKSDDCLEVLESESFKRRIMKTLARPRLKETYKEYLRAIKVNEEIQKAITFRLPSEDIDVSEIDMSLLENFLEETVDLPLGYYVFTYNTDTKNSKEDNIMVCNMDSYCVIDSYSITDLCTNAGIKLFLVKDANAWFEIASSKDFHQEIELNSDKTVVLKKPINYSSPEKREENFVMIMRAIKAISIYAKSLAHPVVTVKEVISTNRKGTNAASSDSSNSVPTEMEIVIPLSLVGKRTQYKHVDAYESDTKTHRKSPREHSVRGFYRTSKNGKVTWVKGFKRGIKTENDARVDKIIEVSKGDVV